MIVFSEQIYAKPSAETNENAVFRFVFAETHHILSIRKTGFRDNIYYPLPKAPSTNACGDVTPDPICTQATTTAKTRGGGIRRTKFTASLARCKKISTFALG